MNDQLRVLPAALGYALIARLRTLALEGMALASAQVETPAALAVVPCGAVQALWQL